MQKQILKSVLFLAAFLLLPNFAKAADGVCGSVNGTQVSSLTSGSVGLCDIGSVTTFNSGVEGNGLWTWTCSGVSGGAASSQCVATPLTILTPENLDESFLRTGRMLSSPWAPTYLEKTTPDYTWNPETLFF